MTAPPLTASSFGDAVFFAEYCTGKCHAGKYIACRNGKENRKRKENRGNNDRHILPRPPSYTCRKSMVRMQRTACLCTCTSGTLSARRPETHMPDVSCTLLPQGHARKDCGNHEILRSAHAVPSPHRSIQTSVQRDEFQKQTKVDCREKTRELKNKYPVWTILTPHVNDFYSYDIKEQLYFCSEKQNRQINYT